MTPPPDSFKLSKGGVLMKTKRLGAFIGDAEYKALKEYLGSKNQPVTEFCIIALTKYMLLEKAPNNSNKSEYSKHLSFRVSDKFYKEVEGFAKEKGVSKSAILRNAIADAVK